MKTDSIEFDTLRPVSEITNILRGFKCNFEKIKDDPFGGAGGPQASIEVLMWGKATMKDAFRHFGSGKSEWGVQVYVYDLGNYRHVELVTLGESGWQAAREALAATGGRTGLGSGYATLANQRFSMSIGKDYRDMIASAIA